MTNILAISGKAQSGKNCLANWILGEMMSALGVVKGGFTVDGKGELYISDLFGGANCQGRFDYYRSNDKLDKFKEEYLHPYIKLYSFADELKAFCVNVLNLKPEQVYGTNEQKDSLTHLKWEDMPGVLTEEGLGEPLSMPELTHDDEYWHDSMYPNPVAIYHKPGYMTGREVLQYFGTNIVRKMYGLAWANVTLNKIERENTLLAVITDCRFPDEVELTQKKKGRVLRLLRNPLNNKHTSEIALDDYPQDKFDAVVDNTQMNVEQQNEKCGEILYKWGFIPEYEVVG